MTPEQLRGWRKWLDGQSAIFSLGTAITAILGVSLDVVLYCWVASTAFTLAMLWFMVLERVAQRQERSR